MNIYVGNLPYSARDDDLRQAFEPFGKVISAEVIMDRRTRRSRGYGFVEMANDTDGSRAIAALNGTDMQGRSLRVDESRPNTENRERPAQERTRGPDKESAGGRSKQANERVDSNGFFGFIKRLFG